MGDKFAAFRWLTATAVMFVLGMNAVGLLTTREDLRELSSTKRQGGIWTANQLEFELLRFSNSLALFIAEDSMVSADDVRFRFDILWSRQSVTENNVKEHTEGVQAKEAISVGLFGQLLRETEGMVVNLKDGDTATAAALLSEYREFSGPLHDYTILVKDEQAALDLSAREGISHQSRLTAAFGVAIGIGSVLLAALFFADSRHQRKISAENLLLLKKSQAAYRAKVEFLSTISHELRTPLTSIKGVLGFFCGGALGTMSDKAKVMSKIAYDNSNKLEALINDIMDSAKSERNDWRFDFKNLDLAELVESSVSSNSKFKMNRTIKLIKRYKGEINLLADATRIDQVISNLLSNALKFSRDGSDVIVTIDRRDDVALVSVQDFGDGISADFKPKVFEKFAQANSSDTRSAGGTGLGLNIAKHIVELHGGTISFESTEGLGTTFTVELPLRQTQLEARSNHLAA